MAVSERMQQLLQVFAGVIEAPRPDFQQSLTRPTAELAEGRRQATALLAGVVRPNSEELDPGAAGRRRFPELQGVACLFAEGLAEHPDLVDELGAGPEELSAAVALDQALGRFLFAGELLATGGEAGELLAATAAQRLCEGVLAEARGRMEDLKVPAQTRADLAVAFTEPFRLQEDARERQQRAQAGSDAAARPYQGVIDRAAAQAELADAVSAYLSSLKDGRTP